MLEESSIVDLDSSVSANTQTNDNDLRAFNEALMLDEKSALDASENDGDFASSEETRNYSPMSAVSIRGEEKKQKKSKRAAKANRPKSKVDSKTKKELEEMRKKNRELVGNEAKVLEAANKESSALM